MGRLPGFDYRKPFFYMVTLAKREGIAPFGSILAGDPVCDANGAYSYHMLNAIGEAFSKTIGNVAKFGMKNGLQLNVPSSYDFA